MATYPYPSTHTHTAQTIDPTNTKPLLPATMGNRSSASSSAALFSPAQLQKRFTAEELRRLEAQAGSSKLTREQFLAKVGVAPYVRKSMWPDQASLTWIISPGTSMADSSGRGWAPPRAGMCWGGSLPCWTPTPPGRWSARSVVRRVSVAIVVPVVRGWDGFEFRSCRVYLLSTSPPSNDGSTTGVHGRRVLLHQGHARGAPAR